MSSEKPENPVRSDKATAIRIKRARERLGAKEASDNSTEPVPEDVIIDLENRKRDFNRKVDRAARHFRTIAHELESLKI